MSWDILGLSWGTLGLIWDVLGCGCIQLGGRSHVIAEHFWSTGATCPPNSSAPTQLTVSPPVPPQHRTPQASRCPSSTWGSAGEA